MVFLRSVEKRDFRAVLALAKELNSYNLPFDRRMIRNLIETSIRSFQGKVPRTKAKYLFVIEDYPSKEIFGASLVIAQQGTSQSPHIYFEKDRSYLKFGATKDGPTEIGGLVLKRPYRRRKEKFGKQLSWVRFLYMALHPERFGKRVLAEFLPPLKKGKGSLFWDALGRRFTGLSYREADRLSVYTKEFVFDLFPKKVTIAFLPKRVQWLLGEVAPEARPACRMLKQIGFHQTTRIEPFDGGPYYEAERRKIAVIRRIQKASFQGKSGRIKRGQQTLLFLEQKGKVRACVGMSQSRKGKLFLDDITEKLLKSKEGQTILYVSFD